MYVFNLCIAHMKKIHDEYEENRSMKTMVFRIFRIYIFNKN